MTTNATRLSDHQLKAVKATGKDFVLSDCPARSAIEKQQLSLCEHFVLAMAPCASNNTRSRD